MQTKAGQSGDVRNNSPGELLTLKQAAELIGKTPSNISYLLQYGRLRKCNSRGEVVERAGNGELRVLRSELLAYAQSWKERMQKRMQKLSISDTSLAFTDIPERERTKHVHRLHPYLGKFIPQLVEHFLGRYFEPGEVVIDPFCGSGTTLVQACEMGMHSIGIDISAFNALIARVKLAEYDSELMEREVLQIMKRTLAYSAMAFEGKERPLIEEQLEPAMESEYLRTWFAERSLQEMLYYRSLIPEYRNQDLLKVILSRTARSCRLTYHYELANPKRPVREPYVCYKHKNKICRPVTTIIPRLKFYSMDTARRITEFYKLRKPCESFVLEGDSRTIRLDQELPDGWLNRHSVKGIFTSPPYVGQIDYHEQHRYAYELFGFGRKDIFEIGRKADGKGERAQQEYIQGIGDALANLRQYLPPEALWFVVANDRLSLYPDIFERAGLKIRGTFQRPVEDRTERDKRPYSESIFLASSA